MNRVFPVKSRVCAPCTASLRRFPGRTCCILGVVGLIITFGPIFAGAVFATTWETSAMRAPGGGLVRVGMSRQEVIKELGQPLRVRATARHTASGGKSGKKNSAWTYRGPDGLYAITFSGETVVRIEVTPDRD